MEEINPYESPKEVSVEEVEVSEPKLHPAIRRVVAMHSVLYVALIGGHIYAYLTDEPTLNNANSSILFSYGANTVLFALHYFHISEKLRKKVNANLAETPQKD